jgi:signal peptidase I
MEPTTSPALDPSAAQHKAAFRFGRLRLAAGLTLLFVASAGITYLGAWPPMATVMSGSMAPKIDTGDVVLLKRTRSAPKLGDIIAVRVPDSARKRYGYPEEVIHRVVAISETGDLSTKGDAREKPDPFTVRRSSVRAKVAFTVPAVGRVFAFLTSTLGLAWMAAGVFLFFVMPRLERQRELQESEQQTIAQLRAELSAISAEMSRLFAAERPPGQTDHRLDMLVREAREARELLAELIEAREPESVTPQGEPEEGTTFWSADTVESEPLSLESAEETVESPAIAFDRIFAPALAEEVEFDFAEIELQPMPAAAPDDAEPRQPATEPEPVVITKVVRRRSGGLIGTGLARARRRVG